MLRIEALVCLSMALSTFLLPGMLFRLLSQAQVGSPVGGLDVVVLVRAMGCVLLGMAAFLWWVPRKAVRPGALASSALIARWLMTAVRWGMVLDLPPPLKVLTWLDLTLALVGTAALLYTRHQKPLGGGAGTPIRPARRTPATLAIAAALGAVALLGYGLLQPPPEPRFASDEDHFKYGSILKPWLPGLPLCVFEALPDAFPDLLPGGWASVGFVLEPGHATPVGWALQPALIPSLAPNCALCHGATYRVDSGESPRFVPGAPAVSLDFDRFLTVIFKAGADPRFTDGTLLAKIKARQPLSPIRSVIYEQLLLPTFAWGFGLLRRDFEWINRQPPSGPGRQGSATILKYNMLRLPYDGTISTSDFRPVWNQRTRGDLFHRWNGGGKVLHQENMLAAAVLSLLQPALLQQASFDRVTNYLASLQRPAFPLPVDQALVNRGAGLFDRHCAECHRPDGVRYNAITPLTEVGTDREYLASSTPEFLSALRAFDTPPFVFDQQQAPNGYLNSSLEAIWVRGPYLHNGSVPTLKDLLERPERRPVTYRRGGNRLDPVRLGFQEAPADDAGAFLFDTRARGNGNGGHLHGVDLPETDKRALIEYLKTL